MGILGVRFCVGEEGIKITQSNSVRAVLEFF